MARNSENRFTAAGVPLPQCSCSRTSWRDSQIAYRGFLKPRRPRKRGERLPHTDNFFKVSVAPFGADRPPPLVGADTDDVLGELGYLPTEIAAFREKSIL